jgi:outer membrane protein
MRFTAMKSNACRGRSVCAVGQLTRLIAITIAITLILGLTIPAAAAQEDAAGQMRIGFVDMVRLFDNAPQLIAAREALDEEFRPRYDALSSDEARVEALTARMLAMGDVESVARQDLEREVRNLRRSIDRRREDLAEEIRFRTTAEKNAIEDTIQIAIRQVAEQGGFDLVLTGPVAFASDRVDMTDQIIAWLERDYAADADTLGSRLP